jgi:hypothetical protein
MPAPAKRATTARKPAKATRAHVPLSRGAVTWLKAAAGAVASAAVICAAVVGIEDRYVHASDLAGINSKLEVNRLTAEVSVLQIRRAQIDDRIYDSLGKLRGKASPEQTASLERSKQEALRLDAEIAAKKRTIERLQTGLK